jgi:predicted amidohydrolase
MDSISVALLQLRAYERAAFSRTWPAILARIADAALAGAKLIVLPEGTVPSYVIGREPIDSSVIENAISDLQQLANAHACVIVTGIAEPNAVGANGLRNSAVVVAPYVPSQRASKRFLWHFDSVWFDPGIDCEPIDTPFGAIGIIVCADGRIPTFASTLVERGARLLVVVTAWVTSGRDPQALENVQADLLARVRARENFTPLVAANKSGCEYQSVLYCGKSQAIAADGSVLAIASQDREESLFVTLPLAPARTVPYVEPARLSSAAAVAAPLRIAVSRRLTREQYEVAAWSEVDLIFCLESDALADASPMIRVLPHSSGSHPINEPRLAAAIFNGDEICNPTYLSAVRRNGYDFFIWRPRYEDPLWSVSIARTRAIELRGYVMLLLPSERICVIDPHGTIVAGTTAELLMLQFVYDPALTQATTIVPNTDIIAGLTLADAMREQL